jgi:hypothetical protein
MPKVEISCSWCHEPNEVRKGDSKKVYCTICGHRADVPRVQCDCRKCRVEHANAQREMEKVA